MQLEVRLIIIECCVCMQTSRGEGGGMPIFCAIAVAKNSIPLKWVLTVIVTFVGRKKLVKVER